MYRTLLILLMAFGLTVQLTACGGGSSGGSTPPTENPEPQPEPEPEPEPEPDGDPLDQGELVITATPATDYSFWEGDNDGEPVGRAETVAADHSGFTQAVRIHAENPPGAFFNGQLQYPILRATAEGDVMLIRLYMRSVSTTDETGATFATVFLEGPGPDYTKYAEREITSTGDWQAYDIPLEMSGAEAANDLILKIGFGGGDRPQSFDIGGVEVLHFGQSVAVEDLPRTELSYGGREADADWRAEAAARIEQLRKGDFTVRVLDGGGQPVEGAEVAVEMTRHAYHFGSVTVGHILMGEGDDNDLYREKVLELFNQSGPENDLKWAPWAGEWGEDFSQQTTIDALQWLKSHDFYTRGHVMVWPSKRNLPELIQEYLPEGEPENADPEAKQIVLDHIDDIASATGDVLDEWDVLNEPYDNHYLMDAFGDEVMVDWFERARLNLAHHKLYINDYSILSGGGRDAAHQDHYQQTIQYLLDQDAPIDGIGMQGHFGPSPTAIPRVLEILDRFHEAFPELTIRVTEFDINTTDEALQADYTRDFLTAVFSHPATVGVQKWGFWAGAHWTPDGAMYTEDWREKPNAVAWKDAIFKDWWNDFTGTTDGEGEFSERGFYGEYQVTINGQLIEQSIELLPGETAEFEITLAE